MRDYACLAHDLLLGHQDGWDDDTARIAEAALRLSDPAGPGDDLLVAVAELHRRHSRGRPDGDVIAARPVLDQRLALVPARAHEFFDAILDRLAGDEAAEQELRHHSALAQLAADPD